jgi:aspartate-semialdehyde dehydrogenase
MTFLELKKNAEIHALRDRFKKYSYFKIAPSSLSRPVSSVSITGQDKIFIGQIKKEKSFPNSFWIWVAADNLTRGSAINALEIAKAALSFSMD